MSINQDTFDEVVKENMEDFGMDKEEAARDAIEQFKFQGANLSQVNTSADGVRRDIRAAVVALLETLRQMESWPKGTKAVECLAILSTLSDLCDEEAESCGNKNKTCLGEAGGIGVVAQLLAGGEEMIGRADNSPEIEVLVRTLSTLQDACRNHERNRDAFAYTNMAQVNRIVVGAMEQHDTGVAEAGLRLVTVVCTKTENNKANFMQHQGATILKTALQRFGNGDSKNSAVTKEACGALRSVTMGDDGRKDFSGTYESVRALVSNGAVLLLLDAAREFKDDSSTLSWVFLALKQLAANNESVKQIVDNGGLHLVSEVIIAFPSEAIVCRTGLSLFRNICANDVFKTKLLNDGGLRLILGCMHEHKCDKTLQEHGCGAMAAMALRSPPSGAKIVEEGGIVAIVEAMRQHPSAQALQRQACLCIRNIAARGPSLRNRMLDEGCEGALREAGKLGGCVDEAYGALRDLRCEVELVTIGENGKVQVGVKAFGEQVNFNATTDETRDIQKRVQNSAAAPAHAGYSL